MSEAIIGILIIWFLVGAGLFAEGVDNLFEDNKVTIGDIFYIIAVSEFVGVLAILAGIIWIISWPFIKISKVVLWKGKNG